MYWNQNCQITLQKRHRGNSTTGKMLKGISNFQIEPTIKNLNDNDINENFVCVFSANHMDRFID